MDHTILKKKLQTFKSDKGSLTGLSDDLIVETLRAWETWPGTTRDLCQELGLKLSQIGFIVRKAKKLIKSGCFTQEDFKEIGVSTPEANLSGSCKEAIVLNWDSGKVIEFPRVDQLVDFLKKAS